MNDPTIEQRKPGFAKTWWVAMRPFSLPASTMPIIFGSVLAVTIGDAPMSWPLFAASFFGMEFLHIGANLLNDVFDFKKGLDARVNPVSGAVVRGWITTRQAAFAALVFFVVGSALGVWIFFRFTRLGYELQAAGESRRTARYARLPYGRLVVTVMVVSGALAGWAGFLEASATLNRLQPSIMAGYGYTAIVVAWLARLNPVYIGLASFLLAGLRVGLENLQLDLQVPAAFGSIMEGLILLTVLAGSFFIDYTIRLRKTS